MNQTDYQKWMTRAFLYVEAALAMELATPSRVCMSEEYLRSSFVRGLSHSKPEAADRVSIEWDAPWTDAKCWRDGDTVPRQGRKIQHDVRVAPEAERDGGMACEAKWLKQAKSEDIVRDIWKLMLSRSVVDHGSALRCYLLVGGEDSAFANAMDTLRNNHIRLNWRDGSKPTTEISLGALLKRQLGLSALKSLLRWSDYVRTPAPCVGRVHCVRRASWYRTLDSTKWRMGLWELSAWGAEKSEIDWGKHKRRIV